MSDPFIGEIRPFAGSYAPKDWAFCDGSLLSISTYDALYSLIGTTYGGNGVTDFALPDLRGRIPIGAGAGPGLTSRALGQVGGETTVTLTTQQIPQHTHTLAATTTIASLPAPAANAIPATPAGATSTLYAVPGDQPLTELQMGPNAVVPVGEGQPHANMMPTTAVSMIICLFGIFPQPN